MMYNVEMPSCGVIFLPSFTKISGGQAILGDFPENVIGCNVGITYGKELGSVPLGCLHVA
jgi:hypothetical protein